MKLEIHERHAILNLLPTEGKYTELKAIRKAREIISFTKKEMDFYEMRQEPHPVTGVQQWVWNGSKAAEKILDAPLEQYIVETVRQKLSEMDKEGKLQEMYVSLFEKFVVSWRSQE